ncbi:hypothetical protein [Thermocatellispora tengchongensis]
MIRWNSEGLDQDGDRMTAQVVRLACEGLWEVATHAPALYDQEAQASLEHHLMSMLT